MEDDYKGPIEYSIEIAAETIEALLESEYSISKRSIALLLLQGDSEIREIVRRREPKSLYRIDDVIREAKEHFVNPISYELALERQSEIRDIINKVVKTKKEKFSFQEMLGRLTMNPITGLPILALVLYWGLYKFVGEFGAGTVVDFLEGTVFDEYINPVIVDFFTKVINLRALQELFVGENVVITL